MKCADSDEDSKQRFLNDNNAQSNMAVMPRPSYIIWLQCRSWLQHMAAMQQLVTALSIVKSDNAFYKNGHDDFT